MQEGGPKWMKVILGTRMDSCMVQRGRFGFVGCRSYLEFPVVACVVG